MDQALIHTALTIIAIVLVYAILARGMLYASEPFRARCIDLYEKMVKSGRADRATISRLDVYLEEVYSNWAAWKLAMLMACAVFVTLPAKRIANIFGATPRTYYLDDVPEPLRADFDKFTSYWMVATVLNSPAAAVIFTLVGIIGIAFLAPLQVIAKIISSHAIPFDHRTAH